MLIWNLENDTLAYIDFSNGVIQTPTGESGLESSNRQKDTVFKDQVYVQNTQSTPVLSKSKGPALFVRYNRISL